MKDASSISLRQMRCFVAVAEELHFRRAAEKLHMSQPPLTQRIQDMERDLGVELFRRTGNKIELTDAGKMVLKASKETLAQAEIVREVAQRAARGECGRIRVGMVIAAPFFASIQKATRVFQAEHPGVSLDLITASSGIALEGLRQRKLDVCLVRPFSIPLPPNCEETTIERDRLMVVLPATHHQARAKKVSLSAIADEKFISVAGKKGHAICDQVINLWEKAALKPHIAQEAENGPVVMALVAAGFGNAILPGALQTIRLDHIVWKTIDVDERWTETSLNLVYHKDALTERVPAAFIECLRRHSSAANAVRPFG